MSGFTNRATICRNVGSKYLNLKSNTSSSKQGCEYTKQLRGDGFLHAAVVNNVLEKVTGIMSSHELVPLDYHIKHNLEGLHGVLVVENLKKIIE